MTFRPFSHPIRIGFLAGIAALGLGCLPAQAQQADFGSCLASLRSAAAEKGVTATTFESATTGLEPNDADRS